jgi:hypothetical protein
VTLPWLLVGAGSWAMPIWGEEQIFNTDSYSCFLANLRSSGFNGKARSLSRSGLNGKPFFFCSNTILFGCRIFN